MPANAADVTERWPNYQEGDFVITNYVFRNGEMLPELKLHYLTLGTARRNTLGKIINGVLLLQGNTGTGANWLRPSLADELFAPGSRSMQLNTSSSCRTRSDVADPASHPMGSRGNFPVTATTTWSNLVIG